MTASVDHERAYSIATGFGTAYAVLDDAGARVVLEAYLDLHADFPEEVAQYRAIADAALGEAQRTQKQLTLAREEIAALRSQLGQALEARAEGEAKVAERLDGALAKVRELLASLYARCIECGEYGRPASMAEKPYVALPGDVVAYEWHCRHCAEATGTTPGTPPRPPTRP